MKKMPEPKVVIEPVKSDFEGTIIDLETLGEFNKGYRDSRMYKAQKITVFGYITNEEMGLIYSEADPAAPELIDKIKNVVKELPKPFCAFNSPFERSVLYHHTSEILPFEKELNSKMYEKMDNVVKELGIENYDDPLNGDNFACIAAWRNKEYSKVVGHNRADLMKERDILVKRGSRKVDDLQFVD